MSDEAIISRFPVIMFSICLSKQENKTKGIKGKLKPRFLFLCEEQQVNYDICVTK